MQFVECNKKWNKKWGRNKHKQWHGNGNGNINGIETNFGDNRGEESEGRRVGEDGTGEEQRKQEKEKENLSSRAMRNISPAAGAVVVLVKDQWVPVIMGHPYPMSAQLEGYVRTYVSSHSLATFYLLTVSVAAEFINRTVARSPFFLDRIC